MNDGPRLEEPTRLSTSKAILLFFGGIAAVGAALLTYCSLEEPTPVKKVEQSIKIEKTVDSIFAVQDDFLSEEELMKIHSVYSDSLKNEVTVNKEDLTKQFLDYLTNPKLNVQNDKGLWNQLKTQEGIITKGVLILGDQRYTFSIRDFYEKEDRIAISQRINGTQTKKDLKTYIDEGLDGIVNKTDCEEISKTQEMYDEFKTRAIEHYQK
ncbi:MAG: hypothetical protein PHU51_05320 [Candidatus Nanoarchaeia archaeon]|nr:hypothetical protein [Candidatus Nanoarchaeia archaeon]